MTHQLLLKRLNAREARGVVRERCLRSNNVWTDFSANSGLAQIRKCGSRIAPLFIAIDLSLYLYTFLRRCIELSVMRFCLPDASRCPSLSGAFAVRQYRARSKTIRHYQHISVLSMSSHSAPGRRRFAPLVKSSEDKCDDGIPRLKGVVFDVDGTLCMLNNTISCNAG